MDLGETFDRATVNNALETRSGGFIAVANKHYGERVVLPNNENVKILDPAENHR